jgi:recombination protein RecR
MNSIDKLTKLFSEFPGIGPKQARRFVYFLIKKNRNFIEEFTNEIKNLGQEVKICIECKRYFESSRPGNICNICADDSRDNSLLMIVSRDIDLLNVEKGHFYNGKYFVLGGTVPILDKNPEERIRLKELINFLNGKNNIKEIILGLDANSEGEYTGNLLKEHLKNLAEKNRIKISELGRGLSIGSELEYSDPETIKNALKNRS